MGCAAQTRTPLDIEVWTGNTPDQLLAALDLWRQWSLEDRGKPLNEIAWAQHTAARLRSQQCVYFVAYHDTEPIGMLQCVWEFDPFNDAWIGYGDHAYVHADFREEGVFRALYDAIYGFCEMMDFDKLALPVNTGPTGKFLKPFYESQGFEPTAIVMKQDAPWRKRKEDK